MNDSTTVTASEYTGRQQRGGTITVKTTGGATDTTSVSQAGKAEFINVPTKTYNAAAKVATLTVLTPSRLPVLQIRQTSR